MGTDSSNKYNNEGTLSIDIEADKTCYFPGENVNGTIILFPRIESIDPLMCEPQLTIKINQRQYYCYSSGSGKNSHTVRETEEITLTSTNINFEKIASMDYSSGFKIPFSIKIPMVILPSIYITLSNSVMHLLTVELPQVKAVRTKVIIVKNNFPPNIGGLLYKQPYEEEFKIDKSKFFAKKGSILLNIKLPRNYFFYNEKIPFEVKIDSSKMELILKSIIISLISRYSYNWKSDLSKERRSHDEIINEKIFNLEKNLKIYEISSEYYVPNVYTSLEKHGMFEMNEEGFNNYLYPSSGLGLVSVNYFIIIKLNFESSVVIDEVLKIPIYFSSNTDNIYIDKKLFQ